MAGASEWDAGWIPVFPDLPTCWQVATIAAASGCNRHEVVGRLVEFWIWAQQNFATRLLARLTRASINDHFYMPKGFVDAMEDVGWLRETPEGIELPNADPWITTGAKSRLLKTRRQLNYLAGKNGASNGASSEAPKCASHQAPHGAPTTVNSIHSDSDNTSPMSESNQIPPAREGSDIGETGSGGKPSTAVDLNAIKPMAAEVFRRLGYSGDDGRFLWQVSALAVAGLVPESHLWAACLGARERGKNRIGYLRTALRERLQASESPLDDALATLPKLRWPRRAPKAAALVEQFAPDLSMERNSYGD